MALTWYIDRVNIATAYGCYVEGSTGLMDMPKAKTPLTVDINDYHGELLDMEDMRYGPRDIVLSCFILGTTMDDFNSKCNALKVALAADGPHQLTITGFTKPVSYIVMCMDGFTVSKQWQVSGYTIGSFQMKLKEMCPVKRILTYTGAGTAGIDSIGFLDNSARIYWGDGEFSTPADATESGQYPHTYSDAGTYYVVITGAINTGVTASYGSLTLLWEQLL